MLNLLGAACHKFWISVLQKYLPVMASFASGPYPREVIGHCVGCYAKEGCNRLAAYNRVLRREYGGKITVLVNQDTRCYYGCTSLRTCVRRKNLKGSVTVGLRTKQEDAVYHIQPAVSRFHVML